MLSEKVYLFVVTKLLINNFLTILDCFYAAAMLLYTFKSISKNSKECLIKQQSMQKQKIYSLKILVLTRYFNVNKTLITYSSIILALCNF